MGFTVNTESQPMVRYIDLWEAGLVMEIALRRFAFGWMVFLIVTAIVVETGIGDFTPSTGVEFLANWPLALLHLAELLTLFVFSLPGLIAVLLAEKMKQRRQSARGAILPD